MIPLSKPEQQYRDRLTMLAKCSVFRGVDVDTVKQEIEHRRKLEGDEVAEDFAKLCREIWRRLGL